MSNSQKTISMLTIVPMVSAMKRLLDESASVGIKALCKEYSEKLKNGQKVEQLCESFVVDLSKVADTKASKKILAELDESVKKQETNIKLAKYVYALDEGACQFVAPMIENAVVDYLSDKNEETRNGVRNAVSLFESDATIQKILETLNYEDYIEKAGSKLTNANLKEQYKVAPEKTYTEAEVQAIINKKVNEMKTEESVPVEKHLQGHIGLHGAIQKILKENQNNEKLKVFLDQYINALNEGKAEELLYESFISGISNWNYLSAVDTEVSALKDRISKYKQDIDLKRILETMKETSSYYIVPLIEDLVVEYAENKSMNRRAVLMQRLDSFDYDPFVRDMMTLITRDLSIPNNVYLGESVEMANKYVHTVLTHSPVQAIKENECVFNVRGSYYARRGNSISKLNNKEVAALSESFKSLCNIINSDNVVINEELNTISVYGEENNAKITESEILINDKKISDKDLESIYENARLNRNRDIDFYVAVKILNENFDNIAYLDFVKSIVSNDGMGRAVDVFRINENIFVNTTDSKLGNSTFYRNVNPIQCRNYINEHMEINVMPLFEDVLPEQKDIEKGVEDKKSEYQSYIDDLEEKKKTLQDMKDEAADSDDIDDAIAMIDKEIEDTKSDFKKFQDDADKYINGDEDDADDDEKNKAKDMGFADDYDKDGDSDDKTHKNTDPDASNETPAEVSVPLTGDDSEDGDEGDDFNETDPEDDLEFDFHDDPEQDYSDVPEFDSDFDVAGNFGDESEDNNSGFDVVRVSYNKNIKTGKSNGKGEVIVIIPSVDTNGDVHDETRKVTFYLDSDRTPVINNEYMPLDLYKAIQTAIENCPETETVSVGDDSIEPTDADPNIPDTPTFSVDSPNAEKSPELPKESKESMGTRPARKESPAEIAAEDEEKPSYPISVGLYPEEIKPKDMDEFEKDLDDMKIEHGESEAKNGERILKISNKSQAHALRKYFHDWMNYNNEEFDNFFPELQKCFNNHPSTIDVMPTNENVHYAGGKKIEISDFVALIPSTKPICESLGITYNKNADNMMAIVPENVNEAASIYKKLKNYSKKYRNIEQDVVDLLESYSSKLSAINEGYSYKLMVPYNGSLESRFSASGIMFESVGLDIHADINKKDFKKVRKILKEVYGKAAPIEVRDFYNFLNENVRITVKDENTGKTVEINTDDFNGSKESATTDMSETETDFDAAFNNSTFDPDKSLLFKDDEESADDDKKDKKESKNESDEATEDEKSEEAKNGDSADNEGSEKKDKKEDGEEEDGSGDKEKKDEKPKKKFTFKINKKSPNESASPKRGKTLNEGKNTVEPMGHGKPNVLDIVRLPNGNKGQIICKQMDGNFIVNVMGHTVVASPKEVKLVNGKFDTLEAPFKYDKCTLNGCYESVIGCGMYVNDMKVTPADTKVQILEYMKTPSDEEVEIIVEGQKTKALKKLIRLNSDEYASAVDLGNYRPGIIKMTNENVLINIKDYMEYKFEPETHIPVRMLKFDESNTTHMCILPGNAVRLNESTDEYHPAYEKTYEEAIAKLM